MDDHGTWPSVEATPHFGSFKSNLANLIFANVPLNIYPIGFLYRSRPLEQHSISFAQKRLEGAAPAVSDEYAAIAKTNINGLILGKSGSGKGVATRGNHQKLLSRNTTQHRRPVVNVFSYSHPAGFMEFFFGSLVRTGTRSVS